MYCFKCGAVIDDNSVRCPVCGTVMQYVVGPQIQPQQSYQQQPAQYRPQIQPSPQIQPQPPQIQPSPQKENENNTGIIIFTVIMLTVIILEIILFLAPGFLTKIRREKLIEEARKEAAATTEATTEVTTEATTETVTEAVTETTTEAVTEATTEATTEEIAAKSRYKESDRPVEMDFRWFWEGFLTGCMVDDYSTILDSGRLEGDWKVMILTDPFELVDSYSMRLLNGNISTKADKTTLELDYYKCKTRPDGDYKDETSKASETFMGSWENLCLNVDGNGVNMNIYLQIEAQGAELMLGEISWDTGLIGYIAFVRPDGTKLRYSPMESGVDLGETETFGKPDDNSGSGNTENNIYAHTPEEIVAMSLARSGAPNASFEGYSDSGEVMIHLFEIVDDHTATWDWYYIDPYTLTGTDFMDNYVDLNPYAP